MVAFRLAYIKTSTVLSILNTKQTMWQGIEKLILFILPVFDAGKYVFSMFICLQQTYKATEASILFLFRYNYVKSLLKLLIMHEVEFCSCTLFEKTRCSVERQVAGEIIRVILKYLQLASGILPTRLCQFNDILRQYRLRRHKIHGKNPLFLTTPTDTAVLKK